MHVAREEIEELAELARLHLTEEEIERMPAEFGRILGYVDRLQKVDTAGIVEGNMSPRMEFRPDALLPIDDAARELILSDFPDRMGDALRVPAVFAKPKG